MGEEPVAANAALAAWEPEIREPCLGSGFNQRFSRSLPKRPLAGSFCLPMNTSTCPGMQPIKMFDQTAVEVETRAK
jgi:hypothetical protein